jgi:hypothetical protein
MSSQPVSSLRDSEPAGTPGDPARTAALALPFDYEGRAWLRSVRWRRPPYDRRGIAVAFVVALLLHLIGLWFVRDWMRLRVAPEDRSDVIVVSLVEPVEPVLSPPPPIDEVEPLQVSAPTPARPSARRATPRTNRAPATPAAPVADSTPQVRLYAPDGRLDLPKLEAEPAMGPFFEFRAPKVVASPILRHDSPLPYTATKFEEYWPSDDETLLDEFIRRNIVSKTMRTKDGGQITCTWVLFIGGCGFGYAPPNPEGLKKLRFEAPLKAVTVRRAEQAAAAAAAAEETPPVLNLNLPVPEEKPVEGDGFR